MKEMDFLAERNKIGLAHSGELQEARERAFEDGRSRTKAEHAHELVMRTEALHNEFTARLHEDKEKATEEAQERLRAEYEIQTKLFSVKISPYVQLLTDNGLFKNTHEAKVGYQYQLLVNGIPAFQPRVFIERHEKIEKSTSRPRIPCFKWPRHVRRGRSAPTWEGVRILPGCQRRS